MIYLDNAATTKPCAEAVLAAVDAMTVNFGNPSSLHRVGLNAQLAIDKARKLIANSLCAESTEIIFTSGATESNNLALRGVCDAYGKKQRCKIVASAVEHSSVNETLSDLKKKGFEVVRVSPDKDGNFRSDDFISACDENTVLITMMQVNHETGHILPVKETFSAVKRRFFFIKTHTDFVQAYMKLNLSANSLCADLISLSGHKIHGAKGVGALFIRNGVRVLPIVTGGKQENGIRSGTESVPLICAFGAAVKKLQPTINERYKHVTELKKYLIDRISTIEGIEINSPENGLSYVVNISVAGKRSETLLHYLASREIYVSSGSACYKGQRSDVLKQFGISRRRAESALRISMTAETSINEIDIFADTLRDGIENVKGNFK